MYQLRKNNLADSVTIYGRGREFSDYPLTCQEISDLYIDHFRDTKNIIFHKMVNFVPSATFSNRASTEWFETESSTGVNFKANNIGIFSLLKMYLETFAVKILTSKLTLSPKSNVREIKSETLSFLMYNTPFRSE